MVSSFRSPVSVVSANHGLSDGFSATRDSRPTIHGRRGATLLELLVVLLIMLILFAITAAAIYKTRARSKTTLADTFKEHNETLTK
ncbi:MAG: prepilin-type N-terminal cleavage/methylation domain-containing protein [Planctomycetota bacterium]